MIIKVDDLTRLFPESNLPAKVKTVVAGLNQELTKKKASSLKVRLFSVFD